MFARVLAIIALAAPSGLLVAQRPVVQANDNRGTAGRLTNDTLVVYLEAREGVWHPEGTGGPGFVIEAFGEEGGALVTPGPLLRMPVGTVARVSVRNRLGRPLALRGMMDHATPDTAATDLAPGARHEFVFTAGQPGTYYYVGRTSDDREGLGVFEDGQLLGALVVDAAPPPPDERLLVVQLWADRSDPQGERHTFLVNGLSWPHTERLHATVGEEQRWRVINATVAPHPMHLHGFYFTVDARGDGSRDTLYAADQSRQAVTEFLVPGATMAMTWRPARPGNWLFHCHFIRHIEGSQHQGEPHEEYAHNHALGGMAGLVTGIVVRPRPGDPVEVPAEPVRRLRLYANERPGHFGDRPGYGFVLEDGNVPARDSIPIPGTPIILRRDEPVAITVVNRTHVGISVHWHGIELMSVFDGVPGWSGNQQQVAPLIAAGDSFTVRFAPDRAGTFIYHTHAEEAEQLASGLYGPLIVLGPGETWDVEHERIFLLGWGGPGREAPPLLNGRTAPVPLRLLAGETYRLRFINITPSNNQRIRMVEGEATEQATLTSWRRYAKDGALVEPHQAVEIPARQDVGAGETYDYAFTRADPGSYTIEITTFIRSRPPVVMRIPVTVERERD